MDYQWLHNFADAARKAALKMVRDRIDQFNERFANSDTGTRSLDSIPRESSLVAGF